MNTSPRMVLGGASIGAAVLALGFVLTAGGAADKQASDAKAIASAKPLRLVVDYGDGVEKHFTAIAWQDGMTVFDLMQTASRHERGIRIEHSGSGTTAMLSAIDELTNQGAGRDSKNWLFFVNGKLATQGMGTYKIKAGDVVRWAFDVYRATD